MPPTQLISNSVPNTSPKLYQRSDNPAGYIVETQKSNTQPIVSYGLILYSLQSVGNRIDTYFLVQSRTYSYEFLDIIRGRYKQNNIDRVLIYLSDKERDYLRKYSFYDLWKNTYNKGVKGRYYIKAKKKYDNNLHIFIDILDRNRTKLETESDSYDFPKGRKLPEETPIDCAIREFREETGLNIPLEIRRNSDNQPICFSEKYVGTDGILYESVYFLARSDCIKIPSKKKIITVDNMRFVSDEVRDVYWLPLRKLKPNLTREKYRLLKKARKTIRG